MHNEKYKQHMGTLKIWKMKKSEGLNIFVLAID